MNRRKIIALLGTGTVVAASGCMSDDEVRLNENGSDTDTGVLGSEGNCQQIVQIRVPQEDPDAIKESIDGSIPIILTGEEDQSAFFDTTQTGESSEEVISKFEEEGFEVEDSLVGEWCGDPVCETRSEILFPMSPSEDAVEEAFPDNIRFHETILPSDESVWHVYSSLESYEEIVDQLDQLGVDENEADMYFYDGCTIY